MVLVNLHRGARPVGLVYLTVEEIVESKIEEAFELLASRGLPAVRGEVTQSNVAGCHYYPGRDQVISWIGAEGLEILGEDFGQEDGWGYRHFLLRALPRMASGTI